MVEGGERGWFCGVIKGRCGGLAGSVELLRVGGEVWLVLWGYQGYDCQRLCQRLDSCSW